MSRARVTIVLLLIFLASAFFIYSFHLVQAQSPTINVTATNNAGQGSGTVSETVNDRAPTLAITSVSPNPAKPGQLVRLNFTASDPDGTVGMTWVDWGDGSTPDLIFKLRSGSMCQRLNLGLNSNLCTLEVGSPLLFRA